MDSRSGTRVVGSMEEEDVLLLHNEIPMGNPLLHCEFRYQLIWWENLFKIRLQKIKVS